MFEEQPPRYQVRWEDGHTSILAPSGGSARIERKKPAAKGKAEEAGRGGWNFHQLDIAAELFASWARQALELL